MAIGRTARRTVHRGHAGLGVGGAGGGFEGGVFDGVAHGQHEVVPHGFDIHECPAMVEAELAVVGVMDGVAEVQKFRGCADVELHALEHGGHISTGEPQCQLHATGVHGTGPHPLVDGHLGHHLAPPRTNEVRHAGPVDHVPGQQVLARQRGHLAVGHPVEGMDTLHPRQPDTGVTLAGR